ncbi:zinc finger protein 862-like [Ceratina calcarata]|uniref:Zinc finger protein 862-like n=1 Tax=Ceratina calcarata TaxID=156304 RepID=A0AAJ7WG66_9HYME|nr:zinc finger protein 862-like [Ceratina calcarata]
MKPPPSKKMAWTKRFCDSWLAEPDFSLWLQKCEGNPFKAFCTYCQKELKCGKSELRKHARGQSHITMLSKRKSFTDTDSAAWLATASLNDRVKRAEIMYVLNIIEHSRSFRSYNHHMKMEQRAVDSIEVLKKMTLKSTKIAAITKNVINETIVRNVSEILRNTLFSILVDESTDVSGYKNLCILARYTYEGAIHTYLLEYVRLREANAEYLYDCFKYSMKQYDIPVRNVIGISVDNASVMVGKHNSFVSRLLEENDSEVVVLPCICHSIHLAACNACGKLPKHVEHLLFSLYRYFTTSPKRQQSLEDIQEVMHIAKQKLRQPSRTRWLALSQCVDRVLKQWNAL